ncbi:hypothetical protein D3C81_1779440 [compost metagenome]
MQQQVARCGHGAARAGAELAERMQRGRPRLSEQPVPRLGSKAADTGKVAALDPLAYGTDQGSHIRTPRPHGIGVRDAG